MLRSTCVNSKLISDIEKNQFVESTIKGGIFMIYKDYSEANKKFLKLYDANMFTSYIIYLDVNNLYGHSMMQLLLTQILDWVNPKDFNLDKYSNDSLIDCFLEVARDYYPLVGKKMKVGEEILP